MSTTRSQYAQALRQLRRVKNITQAELAFRIGKRQGAIARLELGYEQPSAAVREQIAGALLNGGTDDLDPRLAPFVEALAAALVCDHERQSAARPKPENPKPKRPKRLKRRKRRGARLRLVPIVAEGQQT